MRLIASAAVLACSALRGAAAMSPAEWSKQSIYQVMTDRFARTDGSTTAACDAAQGVYCGGSWQGLAKKLPYIRGMGFTAIWISPVVKQLEGNTADGSAYHGYWAQDIYSLNSHFGTADDLKQLADAVHAAGMYLMVDVVTNHMAYDGAGDAVDYSIFNPFSSSSYFHPYCPIDYNNATSCVVCWEGDNIVSLPDVRTEDSNVRNIFNSWIADLVSNYSIDGLRIDSVKEVEQSFWPGFENAVGDMYMVGEMYDGDPAKVAPYQQYLTGLLNYPAYYWITQAFESTSGSISNLANGINTLKGEADNTSLYGSFLENHDQPRFPSLTNDMSLVKNAIAFTMLMDGIPIIYEGQEQHLSGSGVPENREAIWLTGYNTGSELYAYITSLNAIRFRAIAQDDSYIAYQAWPIYSDPHSIAMRKGFSGKQVVSVFTNVGAGGGSPIVTLGSGNTGFTAGQALVDALSCTDYTADSSGAVAVRLGGGLPAVLVPAAQLAGSSICSGAGSGGSTSTSQVSTATSTVSSSCATKTSVAITFDELVTTIYGDTIKIVGNTAALGNWDTANAVALSASQYTSSDPLWSGAVDLTAEAVVQYKYIKVDSSGTVTWEADPNHTYTVPCAAATVSNSWQG